MDRTYFKGIRAKFCPNLHHPLCVSWRCCPQPHPLPAWSSQRAPGWHSRSLSSSPADQKGLLKEKTNPQQEPYIGSETHSSFVHNVFVDVDQSIDRSLSVKTEEKWSDIELTPNTDIFESCRRFSTNIQHLQAGHVRFVSLEITAVSVNTKLLKLTWFLRMAGGEESHSQRRNTWRPSRPHSSQSQRETAGWPWSALWQGTENTEGIQCFFTLLQVTSKKQQQLHLENIKKKNLLIKQWQAFFFWAI